MGCCEGRPERPDAATIENLAVRTSAWTETFFAVFPPSVRFYLSLARPFVPLGCS